MHMIAASLATMLAVAGCAAPKEAPMNDMLDCSAEGAQKLVGRPKSDALGEEAMKLTNTKTIRWIRPGEPVTTDYRTDRLNMELDERDRVIRITCG